MTKIPCSSKRVIIVIFVSDFLSVDPLEGAGMAVLISEIDRGD